MVSWGRAFKGAGGIVGFAIVWWFIGGVVIGAGFYLSGLGYMFSLSPSASFAGMLLGFVLILIGTIIGTLGTLAAFVKVLSEIVAEEVRGIH